ncbi:MAG: sulfate ABC transporter ATP-binding protein [Planctomycetes bacterium]|nr:sulfate ABC transporter ATP-binding protein [Planctomycetota bacterium]
MSIEISRISKTFGKFTALRDVSLLVPDGELVALLGPSGSGKTTLLRIISGLEQADEGSGAIKFHGNDVGGSAVGERGVGFVFQHYALFKHMTVFENIAFGLRVRPRATRPTNAKIADRVRELLRLIQLEGLEKRYPTQLSGGQRQRIALARALAVEPRVLLLDEPFGALDAQVRQELRRWLRRLHDEIHVTSVFVTHDQEEALEVADRIVVMNQGRIEQQGTPDEVFHQPANAFVMNFLGQVNLFHGRVEEGKADFGNVALSPAANTGGTGGQKASLFVRPHDLDIRKTPEEGKPAMPATVRRVQSAGPVVRVELEDALGRSIQVHLPHERHRLLKPVPGEGVFLVVKDARMFVDDFSI